LWGGYAGCWRCGGLGGFAGRDDFAEAGIAECLCYVQRSVASSRQVILGCLDGEFGTVGVERSERVSVDG
jgi:hypothetical protein